MPSLIQHDYYNSILIFITYNSNIHYLLIFIVFNLKFICKCFNNYNFGRGKGLIYKVKKVHFFIIDRKYIPPICRVCISPFINCLFCHLYIYV